MNSPFFTLARIGTISANGDKEIGEKLAQAMEKVGKQGVISMEDAKGMETTLVAADELERRRAWMPRLTVRVGLSRPDPPDGWDGPVANPVQLIRADDVGPDLVEKVAQGHERAGALGHAHQLAVAQHAHDVRRLEADAEELLLGL